MQSYAQYDITETRLKNDIAQVQSGAMSYDDFFEGFHSTFQSLDIPDEEGFAVFWSAFMAELIVLEHAEEKTARQGQDAIDRITHRVLGAHPRNAVFPVNAKALRSALAIASRLGPGARARWVNLGIPAYVNIHQDYMGPRLYGFSAVVPVFGPLFEALSILGFKVEVSSFNERYDRSFKEPLIIIEITKDP